MSSFCHSISFLQYKTFTHSLTILQSMHGYLHIKKGTILPVRIAKLSPKTLQSVCVYSVICKGDNIEHQ